MKNLKFLLVFAFLVTTFTNQVFAQPYPITSTTQLSTPQLPQLETLADPTNNTVFLSLILNDITQPTYNLRLKLVISGNGINIETNQEVFTPSPINLQYNVPVLLNGADLAEYFKLDNLRFSGITKDEYLNLGTLPEGLYSVCFEAYDYNRFLEPPVSNRSCATSKLEVHDPPVIINPIGEQPLTTPQQLQFNWQNRHIGSFPVEYELRIYEKRKGLTDDQILVSMPPLFRAVTKLPTYNYGLKDPLLKEAQEYLTVVQVRDLTEKNYFKNLGNSQPETFVLKTPCRPGLACSDNDDCTINDTYDKDCNCIGTPFYDPNDDGISDPVTIPAPTIVKPNNEICVNDGKSVIAWTPNHNLNIEVEYDLSIWLEKVDVTQTREYIKYQQELQAELDGFLSTQKEEYSVFIKEQQAATDELTKELEAIEAECQAKIKQAFEDFTQKQAEDLAEFQVYIRDFTAKCERDKQALIDAFQEELKLAAAEFQAQQNADLAEFEVNLTTQQAEFLTTQQNAAADFDEQQVVDLAEFLAQQAENEGQEQAQLEKKLTAIQEAQAAVEAEYQTCMEEASDFKKATRADYLENIAPIQKEIGVVNLVIQNLKTNFVDTRLKLKEQLATDLSNTKSRTEKRNLRSDYQSAVEKARTEVKTDLGEESVKKEDLKAEIAVKKAAMKTALENTQASIAAMIKACETERTTDLQNLEKQQTAIKNALANQGTQAKADYDAFLENQQKEAANFAKQQQAEATDFNEKLEQTVANFKENQAANASDFQNSQLEREAVFNRKLNDCKALIAEESAFFNNKQIAEKAAFEQKMKKSGAACSMNTQAELDRLAAIQKKEQAAFLTQQKKDLVAARAKMSEQLAVYAKELEAKYSKGLPKLVYTNKLDTLYQHILPTDYELMPGYTYTTQVKASVPCGRVTIENKGLSGMEMFVITGEQPVRGGTQPTRPTKSLRTISPPVVYHPYIAPPEILPASSVTVNSFQANWRAVKSATYYILEVATDANFQNMIPAYSGIVLSARTTSFTVSELEGQDFYYRVRAGNDCYLSEFSAPTNVTLSNAPDCRPGTACDDKNDCTINDTYNTKCQCIGEIDPNDRDGDKIPDACDDDIEVPCEAGMTCDDGDDCTINDIYDADCNCTGTIDPNDRDLDKIPDACDPLINTPCQAGAACDDANDCTINDVYDENCNCAGTPDPVDVDKDGIPDICDEDIETPCVVGAPCDDGDSCTINDVFDADCVCVGVTDPNDLDLDGIPDICDTSVDSTCVVGAACDDGVACTIDDVYNVDCQCVGVTDTTDVDMDGIPDACDVEVIAPCVAGNACDDGNDCTVNDVYDDACVCAGTPDPNDSDEDGTPDACDEDMDTVATPIALEATQLRPTGFVAHWQGTSPEGNYLIEVSTNPDFTDILPDYDGLAVTGDSLIVSGLDLVNQTYYYRIQEVGPDGTVSEYSNVITVAPPIPQPPVMVAVTEMMETGFTAHWTGEGEYYLLEVATDNGFVEIVLPYDNMEVLGTQYIFNGLMQGTTYSIRVRAMTPFGLSDYSNVLEVTVGEGPEPPVSLPALDITRSTFLANWEPHSTAENFLLEVAADPDFGEILGDYNNLSTTELQHAIANLDNTRTYYYRIRAENDLGISDYSNVIEVELSNFCTASLDDEFDYSCGEEGTLITDFPDLPLLTELKPGDTILASEFLVIIDEVSGGSPFSGTGHFHFPDMPEELQVNTSFTNIEVDESCRMVGGFMGVEGVGVALLSEEALNHLNNILETIESIDDILASIEDILTTIDQILALVEAYLPDEVIDQMVQAQTNLLLAEIEYNDLLAEADDPPTPEQQAQIDSAGVELQTAISGLQTATQVYTSALGEFFNDFINIVVMAVGELYDDFTNPEYLLNFNSAKGDLETYVENENSAYGDGIPIDPDIIIIEYESEISESDSLNLANQNPIFVQKAEEYYKNEYYYALQQVIFGLKEQVTDQTSVLKLGELLLEESIELLDMVGQMLKNEVPEEDIVDAAKVEILNGITNILTKL